jgi:hypothetical protein
MVNKCSDVLEEHTLAVFMMGELVWANAEVTWRKDFVDYVERLR